MHIVITGAAGFIGKKLAARLARDCEIDGKSISKLTLFDIIEPEAPLSNGPEILTIAGDITETGIAVRLVGDDCGGVFHLAAIVSAGAEEDFDLGMAVNLDANRALLEACRALPNVPKYVFASSVASFGGYMPDVLDDATERTPQTSYGMQKSIGDLLVTDYTRKGFLRGCALRLPTVVVRPGKPNKAASTWASSIIREPLQGDEVICPVHDQQPMFVTSPTTIVENMIKAWELPAEDWGMVPAITLPGLTLTVKEMLAALERVSNKDVVAKVKFVPDAHIQKICDGWPTHFETPRAERLGFCKDSDYESIIRGFMDNDMVQNS
ncbi:SDR family oxidoreductase [Alphaproteobacteria bacterium]|nr:SDR family oxidoreductase [Alphaproteobacteria bacterium]